MRKKTVAPRGRDHVLSLPMKKKLSAEAEAEYQRLRAEGNIVAANAVKVPSPSAAHLRKKSREHFDVWIDRITKYAEENELTFDQIAKGAELFGKYGLGEVHQVASIEVITAVAEVLQSFTWEENGEVRIIPTDALVVLCKRVGDALK